LAHACTFYRLCRRARADRAADGLAPGERVLDRLWRAVRRLLRTRPLLGVPGPLLCPAAGLLSAACSVGLRTGSARLPSGSPSRTPGSRAHRNAGDPLPQETGLPQFGRADLPRIQDDRRLARRVRHRLQAARRTVAGDQLTDRLTLALTPSRRC